MYYLETLGDLRLAIRERRLQAQSIRAKVDAWMIQQYGLSDFIQTSRHYFGLEVANTANKPILLLARQLASMNIEEVACRLFASAVGFDFLLCSFKADSFCTQNHDKRQRVKVPWLSWSKKGNPVVRKEHVATQPIDKLESLALDRIETIHGPNLFDYHNGLGRQVFGVETTPLDISALHERNLRQAKYRPNTCHLIDTHGHTSKVNLTAELVSSPTARLRPPAHWYYPLYLSWFLDGSMVLLETYENPASGVPEAKEMFVRAMNRVFDQTGLYPLVARIPALTDDLLVCNTHLLGVGAYGRLAANVPLPDDGLVIHDLLRQLADQTYAFRE